MPGAKTRAGVGMKEFKDLREAAEFVLFIQDACNSRAIIRDFPAVMAAITEFDPQSGTEGYNSHPLVVLILDKLAQLSHGYVEWRGYGDGTLPPGPTFGRAYQWAREKAGE